MAALNPGAASSLEVKIMSKIKVRSLKPFDMFDGTGLKSVGEEFSVETGTAAELEAFGLAERVMAEEAKPKRKARANEDE